MRSFRLWMLFVGALIACFIFSFFFSGFLVYLLVRLEVIIPKEPVSWIPLIGFAIMAAFVSFTLTLLASRYFFSPIHDLIVALNAVAKGDFKIRLPETRIWSDLHEVNINFNRMVKELNSIELLQSDFIQDVSHEIKTPLAAIEGYATLLSSCSLTAEQKEYLDRILESSRRLSSLTGNILTLSKLENQQILPEKKLFLLDEQLRQCILSMEPLWSEKNIDLDIDLQEVRYSGNESLLSQVWTNLLSNAIKFTPKGGTITVCLVNLESGIRVSFKDTGIGMDEDVQAHIFNKFYQADHSRNSSGNGLGLALVKRILVLSGGDIQVESSPGHGSVFTVTLPVS